MVTCDIVYSTVTVHTRVSLNNFKPVDAINWKLIETMKLITIHLLCLLISYITCYQVTDQIDFERDCQTQRQVSDSSIVEVFAYPRAGVIPEISVCSAKFVAYPPDRKLRIYINEFFLGPGACGHKLKIYDGDPFQTDPKWELTCGAVLTTYTSATNQIILSFTKPSVDSSQLYKFNIKITTDRDDSTLYFDALKTPSNEHFDALKIPANHALQHRKRRESANIPSYTAPSTGTAAASGGGLTSGAIAGIAVGCVVGAVIIIAICIYALWRMLRKAEEKKRYGANEPPPVFVTSTSSNVNGILKHPGSTGSTRSKGTKSRGFDNDAFSDISESKNSKYSEKQVDDRNANSKYNGKPEGNHSNRYDEEMGRGSYSRRGRDKSEHDVGHQNPSYMDDENDQGDKTDRYGDKPQRLRQSYKEANEEKQHISLADLAKGDSRANVSIKPRKYGDESSRTESSFQTDTTNRTYSDSQDSKDESVSHNPGGRFRRNTREGSIRRSRSRSKSMTSSVSGQTRRTNQRSSSADRAEQARQQGSHRQHHHHHHKGSSGSSRRKKQKPPDPYLPIFAETKKIKKKHGV